MTCRCAGALPKEERQSEPNAKMKATYSDAASSSALLPTSLPNTSQIIDTIASLVPDSIRHSVDLPSVDLGNTAYSQQANTAAEDTAMINSMMNDGVS